MVPTWLRCPRELGYFYTLQRSKLRYTDTTPACQLFCFVLFRFVVVVVVNTPQEQANSQTSLGLVLQVSPKANWYFINKDPRIILSI